MKNLKQHIMTAPLFNSYEAYLKCVNRGNELTNNSYKVYTREEWIKNEEAHVEAQKWS
jgi:hypothetical protein